MLKNVHKTGWLCSPVTTRDEKLNSLDSVLVMKYRAILHLQVVVTHDTQERYDCVQYGQAAKRRRHVTRALLQDEILQCTLVFLLCRSAPTIPGVFIVRVVTSNLRDTFSVLTRNDNVSLR